MLKLSVHKSFWRFLQWLQHNRFKYDCWKSLLLCRKANNYKNLISNFFVTYPKLMKLIKFWRLATRKLNFFVKKKTTEVYTQKSSLSVRRSVAGKSFQRTNCRQTKRHRRRCRYTGKYNWVRKILEALRLVACLPCVISAVW